MRIEDSLLATLCGALLLALMFSARGPASPLPDAENCPPKSAHATTDCPRETGHAAR